MGTKWHIGIDESVEKGLWVVVAVMVPEHLVDALYGQINDLRRTIKAVLIAEYPGASSHPKLQGEQLPEIHAFEMFQSCGYYYQSNPGRADYYKEHHAWLVKAMEIMSQHEVQIRFLCLDESSFSKSHSRLFGQVVLQELQRLMEERPLGPVGLAEFRKFKSRLVPIMDRLDQQAYPLALPLLLGWLDQQLEGAGGYGTVVCDDHEQFRDFGLISGFEMLKELGYYSRLGKPTFKESASSPLLQMADVAAFMLRRLRVTMSEKASLKKFLRNYLRFLLEGSDQPNPLVDFVKRFEPKTQEFDLFNPHLGQIVAQALGLRAEFIVRAMKLHSANMPVDIRGKYQTILQEMYSAPLKVNKAFLAQFEREVLPKERALMLRRQEQWDEFRRRVLLSVSRRD